MVVERRIDEYPGVNWTKRRRSGYAEAISFYNLDARHWSEEMTYLDSVQPADKDLSPALADQRRLWRIAVETYGLKERYFAHITGEDGD